MTFLGQRRLLVMSFLGERLCRQCRSAFRRLMTASFLRQRHLRQRCSASGLLLATLLIKLIGQCFLLRAACRHCLSAIATRVQHSCSYCRQARAASHYCRRAVFWARRIWRRQWRSQRKMVVVAAVHRALAARASKRRWQQAISSSRSCYLSKGFSTSMVGNGRPLMPWAKF